MTAPPWEESSAAEDQEDQADHGCANPNRRARKEIYAALDELTRLCSAWLVAKLPVFDRLAAHMVTLDGLAVLW